MIASSKPPPLPPRPREPFPLVDEPPLSTDTPQPETVRTAHRDAMPPPASPYELTELLAETRTLLQAFVQLQRQPQFLPLPSGLPTPVPVSIRTRGKAAVAGLVAGKYAGVVILGGIVLRAVAKQWPQFGGLIEGVLQALGL